MKTEGDVKQVQRSTTDFKEQSIDTSEQVRTAYFYTPGLKGLVQQIVHMAFFCDGLSLVSGEKGIGKTALAHELVKQFDQAHDVVSVNFNSDIELAECIERLCEGLHIQQNQDLSVGEMLADLRHYIQALFQDDKQVIVIIDGAQHLDDQSLGALLSLVQGKPEGNAGLHIIFLAEPGLDQRIDRLQVLDITVYDFQIPKFSPSELANFLAAESPLGAKLEFSQVQKLWAETLGIPGLALAGLRRGAGEKAEAVRAKIPFGHIAAVSLLMVVLLLSFWIYDDKGADSDRRTVTDLGAPLSLGGQASTALEQAAIKPEVSILPTLAPQIQAEKSETVSGSEVAASEVQNVVPSPVAETLIETVAAREGSSAENVQTTIAPIAPTPLAADESASSVELKAGVQPEEVAVGAIDRSSPSSSNGANVSEAVSRATPQPLSDSTPRPTAVQEKPKPLSPSSQSITALDGWERFLMSQKADAYTLQVIAASNNVSLEGYIARQANKSSLRMYRGEREGKKWFVVVQGVYPNKQAAIAAIATLPKEQAKAGPWPRKLASIQEEIATFRRSSR